MVHGGLIPASPRPDQPERRWKSVVLWLLGRRRRIRINGNSMAPFFCDGDEVFVDPGAYLACAPRVGDVVLSAHPYRTDTLLVKSVREVTTEGAVFLVGANPAASTDSRSFGAIPPRLIRGRVVTPRRTIDK